MTRRADAGCLGGTVTKRNHHFQRIAEFKERFMNLPTATLVERANSGVLQKEAAIAIRELLEERRNSSEQRG